MHKFFSIVGTYIRNKSYQHGRADLEVGFLVFQFLLTTIERMHDDRLWRKRNGRECDVFFQKNIKP
jgi:hypothetical protein